MKTFGPGFKNPFSAIVIAACIVFTGWQSIKCVMKYINMPKGTSLSIKNIDKISYEQFPAITICPWETEGFNEDRLKECNIQVTSK